MRRGLVSTVLFFPTGNLNAIKMIQELKFKTIDDWNRPVFKLIDKEKKYKNCHYFGSVDILFNYGATGEEVLKKVTEKDIVYFGIKINDDPLGTEIDPNKIKLIL